MGILSKAKTAALGALPEDVREKKLLVKIDWFILSFSCLLYWVNYLDRLNISNAYVSGMKEDLNMHGNEFNVINTCFSVGYIVFLIPHNLVLLKVKPKIWLSFCGLAWGLLTLGVYKVTSFKQICVIRFFQAGFELSTFTGVHLILSQWYKETELAKRSAYFTSSGLLGNIFSSTLQAAIYLNMDGTNGLAGWRWLFIIDFLITLPVVLYGFICFPSIDDEKSIFFSPDEMALARSRLPPRPKTDFNWSIVTRVVGRWHWWLFSFLWVLGGLNESFATNALFSLWLQFYEYSVPDRNHFPMGIYAIGILATVSCAMYIDFTGAKNHYRAGFLMALIMVIASILLLAQPTSKSFMFAAQYLGGFAYAGQAAFFAWANVVCARDLEEKAVVLASMNMFSNAVNAWWLLLFFSADTAPKFRRGGISMICTAVASMVVCAAIRYLQVREQKKVVDNEQEEVSSTLKEDVRVDVESLSN